MIKVIAKLPAPQRAFIPLTALHLFKLNEPSVGPVTRDDLSFTARDDEGRMINWPRNNPGVAADWKKGMAFFDHEIVDLAGNDETEAFKAIWCALEGMGGRYTCLEIGFIDRVARAAMVGLRALRDGVEQFEPTERESDK